MVDKRRELYRLPEQGKILGVCAGLARYSDFDVTLMRVIFVVLAFVTGGTMIVLYFILAFIMPSEKTGSIKVESMGARVEQMGVDMKESGGITRVRNYAGAGLIIFGSWLLLGQLFPDWVMMRWDIVWPAVLVFVGVMVVIKGKKNE